MTTDNFHEINNYFKIIALWPPVTITWVKSRYCPLAKFVAFLLWGTENYIPLGVLLSRHIYLPLMSNLLESPAEISICLLFLTLPLRVCLHDSNLQNGFCLQMLLKTYLAIDLLHTFLELCPLMRDTAQSLVDRMAPRYNWIALHIQYSSRKSAKRSSQLRTTLPILWHFDRSLFN